MGMFRCLLTKPTLRCAIVFWPLYFVFSVFWFVTVTVLVVHAVVVLVITIIFLIVHFCLKHLYFKTNYKKMYRLAMSHFRPSRHDERAYHAHTISENN